MITLIGRNCDFNSGTVEQWKDILDAVKSSYDSVLEVIKEELKKQDQDAYQKWAQKNFDINHQFDVLLSMKDNRKLTLFHMAACNGHTEMVSALVKAEEIDVNATDEDGRTPLHLAARYGHKDIVDLLVSEGADVNAVDEGKCTPLHYAAKYGHTEIVKHLVENRAKVDEKTANGWTPLHFAALNISLEIVQYLIEKGAKVDEKAANGWTPLHFAAIRDYLRIIKYLIDEKNADPSLKNNSRETPLCFAINNYSKCLPEFLIAHEVKKNSNAKKPEYLENPGTYRARERSEYWDKCLDEIERMKQGKIDQGITLYDILVSKNNRLASFIRNERVMNVLEKSCYKSEFPIYANDLGLQFKVGRQRLDDLNIGETVTRHFGVFMGRQGPFNLRIAEYLNNKDLKILKKAAIQTMDEGDCKLEIREEIPKSLSNLNVENLNEVVRSARRA